MTDTIKRPEWHTTSEGPEAEIAELRRRLADAELRAMNAVQAEDVAQFAFETAKRRADRAEAAARALLAEFVIEPKVPEGYPEMPGDVAEGIADALLDEMDEGVAPDDLDPSGLIEGWVEGRR